MEPAIRVGDVVLTRHVPTDQLQPGHVLLVEDPAQPGHRVMHRYDHQDEDGALVLRGDANRQEDSTPVSGEDVLGVGVLRVPWVGAPYVWVAEGRYVPVGLTAVALLLLMALSPIREREEGAGIDVQTSDDAGDDSDSDSDLSGSHSADLEPARATHRSASAAHAVVVIATLLAVSGTAASVATPASAEFSDSITITASFSAGTWEEPTPVEGE